MGSLVVDDTPDYAADLAEALGLDLRWARALCRAGGKTVHDMASWTVEDVRRIRWVGEIGRAAIIPALRAAGIPLPDVEDAR